MKIAVGFLATLHIGIQPVIVHNLKFFLISISKREFLSFKSMEAVEALTLVGGYVSEELLLRNEYLAAENEILRSKIMDPIRLKNEERIRLAEIGV